MEERRWDDSQHLTPHADHGDLRKALADVRNKSVTLHKPGSMIVKDDGTRWIVQHDGGLREAREDEQP